MPLSPADSIEQIESVTEVNESNFDMFIFPEDILIKVIQKTVALPGFHFTREKM